MQKTGIKENKITLCRSILLLLMIFSMAVIPFAVSAEADNAFTLTFNANGGTGAPGKVTRVSSKTYAGYRFDYRYPTRKGYVFYTWNTRKDGKGKSYKGGSLIKLTKNKTTLYAIWKKGNRFSINYTPNGGSEWPAETISVSSGQSCKLKVDEQKPVRKGYKFLSWNTRSNGSGTSYKPGQTITLKKPQEFKLYARWQRIYTYELTFNANGGTGAPDKITATSPDKSWGFDLPDAVPTRSGYTFVSWNTMKDGKGSTYSPGGRLVRRMGSPKANLYAIWKKGASTPQEHTYTLNLSLEGGFSSDPTKITETSKNKSYTITIPRINIVREGYTFGGWNTKKDGRGDDYYGGNKVQLISASPNITLYALWYKNGGAGGDNPMVDDPAISPAPTPTPVTTPEDGYVDAAIMYVLLNNFRTTNNTWCWNEDNVTKKYYNTNDQNRLRRLYKDPILEEAARIRAKEISIKYSHERPNGQFFDSLSPLCQAECYATGASPERAFEILKETDCDYNGQGHRRGMLEKLFKGVGIAGYRANGRVYWVMLFTGINNYYVTSSAEERVGSRISGAKLFVNGQDVTYKTLSLSVGQGIVVSVQSVPYECAYDVYYNTNTFVKYYDFYTKEYLYTKQIFPAVDYTETYGALGLYGSDQPTIYGISGVINGKVFTTQKDTEITIKGEERGSAPIIAKLIDEFGNKVIVSCRVDVN